MRPYHECTPDQSFLLPPSLDELIAVDDPVRFLREVLPTLDLGAFHTAYRSERGRPPYDPEMMLGLLLYGHMRRIRSSRRLAEACRRGDAGGSPSRVTFAMPASAALALRSRAGDHRHRLIAAARSAAGHRGFLLFVAATVRATGFLATGRGWRREEHG